MACEAELDPSWKFCIHCGIAVDAREIPGAIRPERQPPASGRRVRRRNAIYLAAGVVALLVGLGLLGFSVAYFVGALR